MTHALTARSSWRTLVRPAGVSLVGRGVGGLLLVAYQAVIARRVGIDGLGAVTIALAITSIAAVVGRRGADLMVLRDASLATSDRAAASVYRTAVRSSCRPLLLLAIAQAFFALTLARLVFDDPDVVGPLLVMAFAVPGYGLVALQGEALKGRSRMLIGTIVQSVVGPAIATVLVLCLPNPSPTSMAAMFAVGATASAVAAHGCWRRVVGGTEAVVTESPGPSFSTASRPFLLASVWTLGLTWSPLLLTGVLGDTLAVGRFAAADRIAQVLPLMLVAVNAAVGPVVAPLFASGDVDAVRAVLRRCTMASAVAAAAVCGGLALGAPLLLSVFDAESATGALRVLLVGHFVVLACGPASVTLAMTGAELTLHRISAVALSAQIVLLLALVPRWGATGAAVASAFAWGGSRLATALVARRPMLTPRVATPIGVP